MIRFAYVCLFLFSIIFHLSADSSGEGGDFPVAEWNDSTAYSIDGEWKFYWNQLETSSKEVKGISPDEVVSFLTSWGEIKKRNPAVSDYGYATYCLTLYLPREAPDSLLFQVPQFEAAVNIFINGKLVYKNGAVGTNKQKSYISRYRTELVPVKAENNSLDIAVQTANYSFTDYAFYSPLLVGAADLIIKRYVISIAIEAILLASLFVIVLYNFIISTRIGGDKLFLFFLAYLG